ncbi:sensor domain-containing protein [Bacillus massilinigeriensis]|uniref:sensor domain-containing protein n=1 Tax=Bacillus mediterraneensis TaxID=1805474 RepID=UPI0008F88330|nr:bifunctional diguanylate cyclase/phosphodiesterase [Bacillus mediterraneensis]
MVKKEDDILIKGGNMEQIIFHIIFKHVKDLVFIMEVEEGNRFRYAFANQNALLHADVTAQCLGKTLEEVLPEEKAKLLQSYYRRAAQSGKIISFHDEVEISSNCKVFGETILTPVKDGVGKVIYIVGVTRDVTQSFKEKRLLMESEQKYRSIVDHSLDGVLSINLSGDILEVNPAAVRMTGYNEELLKQMDISVLFHPEDLPTFRNMIFQTHYGLAMESFDCRFRKRNKQFISVQIKTVPIIIHSQIEGVYVIIRDISEQAKTAEIIKYMAFHDQLTGILNRRALLEKLDVLLKGKKEKEFSLFSMDLDRFKLLNDTIGHLAGDVILKQVAERLSGIHSSGAEVFRQGGDEFVILLHNSSRHDAGLFAQKILAAFSDSFYHDSKEYYLSPSIGISVYPYDGKNAETLIKNANEALYRVKEKGKAHFQFYCPDMNKFNTNVIALETQLRKAAERGEFKLHYQPQVNLRTKEVESMEALLRWDNPELGSVSPGEFIPVAEDTGLIVPIGNWVIQEACKQIQEWRGLCKNGVRVAVNISPKQFLQLDLLNIIEKSLNTFNIPPHLLEIEITEGAMQDTKEAIPILKKMKDLGLIISVDDFGTGYSSLNYLKQFPIDILKIDQSFVKDLPNSNKDAAIISSIIHLGRSLGLEVIAEGVEEECQAEFLKKGNCDKAQGYFFARPMPACSAEKIILEAYQ